MFVVTPDEMRSIDERAIREFGIPGIVLMENAALAVFNVIKEQFEQAQLKRILVLAGTGNNGGDGFAVARHLHLNRYNVRTWIINPEGRQISGDAATNLEILLKMQCEVISLENACKTDNCANIIDTQAVKTDNHADKIDVQTDKTDKHAFKAHNNADVDNRVRKNFNMSEEDIFQQLQGTTLIVDALFGTGLARPVAGLYKTVIDAVNNSCIPVISVDIPSGINGETGGVAGFKTGTVPKGKTRVISGGYTGTALDVQTGVSSDGNTGAVSSGGTAIRAEHTVTFGYLKRGHLFYPGREYAGRVHVAPISLPADSAGAAAVRAFTLTDEEAAARLRPRPADGHKGTFGRVAVLAGSAGFTGAAYLAAQSALKSGAGLVTLGIPASLNPIMEVKLTEVMTLPLPDDGSGRLAAEGLNAILDMLKGKDVLALGPGLGKSPAVFEIIRNILGQVDISIVVDADGLNNISQDITLLHCHKKPLILTPHPGEMARLTGMTVTEILENPAETAQSFAKRHGCIILLKGAASVVADPNGRLYINSSGNSGMGTGGTGDCLTGIIAALAAQGYEPFEATVLGCYIHGRAGDMAAEVIGETGMAAGDLLDNIPGAFQMLFRIKSRQTTAATHR